MEALSKLKKGEGLTKLLTEEEIQEHKDMRKEFPNYPRLPKFILIRKVKGVKKNHSDALLLRSLALKVFLVEYTIGKRKSFLI
jgi:hypothetical protein